MKIMCLVTFYDPQNDNFVWNFQLGQNSDVILSRSILGGRGIRGGVLENNANRFTLRMANLLVFNYNGGIKKLLYSFSLSRKSSKRVQKVRTTAPSPQKKSPLGSPFKIAFRRFLFLNIHVHLIVILENTAVT